jgi:hypothetical protein
LTILAPSQRWGETHGKRHKTLTDWDRQAILQTKRWLPGRDIVFVADSMLCRHRVDRGCRPPRLSDHPAAARCQSVQARPETTAGSAWPSAAEGSPTAEAECNAGQSKDGLDDHCRVAVVQRTAAQAAVRHRNRGVVSQRSAAGARCGRRLMAHRCPPGLDPLGAGSRSFRRARPAGSPQHGSCRDTAKRSE